MERQEPNKIESVKFQTQSEEQAETSKEQATASINASEGQQQAQIGSQGQERGSASTDSTPRAKASTNSKPRATASTNINPRARQEQVNDKPR